MTHPDLTTLSAPGALAEIIGAKNELQNYGVTTVNTFAYPYGAYNSAIEADVAKNGFIGARSVNSGFNTPSPPDRYAIMHEEVDRDITLAQVESWINTAAQTKTWLVLTFHLIDTSTDLYGTTPTEFQQIIAYLQTAKVSVQNFGAALSQLSPPSS
jgi:peptidoglycan/xylan/chitin deacetylase (PgdA/CDA1 family)